MVDTSELNLVDIQMKLIFIYLYLKYQKSFIMHTKFIIIILSLIFPVNLFAYSFDQKTSDKKSEVFYDFSAMPYDYVVPHRYNTTLKAAKIENHTLNITLESGMRGSSTDLKYQRTERAEIGFKMPINVRVYYSFKIKTLEGFKTVNE